MPTDRAVEVTHRQGEKARAWGLGCWYVQGSVFIFLHAGLSSGAEGLWMLLA